MEVQHHYAPVTEALEKLRKKGFTVDFNTEGIYLTYKTEKFGENDFDIVEVYRYEGDSDPGDEATVYGIQSKSGVKGVLVTGYGMSSDSISTAILKKLQYRPE